MPCLKPSQMRLTLARYQKCSVQLNAVNYPQSEKETKNMAKGSVRAPLPPLVNSPINIIFSFEAEVYVCFPLMLVISQPSLPQPPNQRSRTQSEKVWNISQADSAPYLQNVSQAASAKLPQFQILPPASITAYHHKGKQEVNFAILFCTWNL